MPKSRWVCPSCDSENVEVCLPTWYREDIDGTFTPKFLDSRDEIMQWYCPDCSASEEGYPKEQP